jgi:exopolysaccharide biosynthesis polyprenyl glycosylphosphotransferase
MTNPHRKALLALLKLSDLLVVAVSLTVCVTLATPEQLTWMQVLNLKVRLGNVLFVIVYLAYWHVVLRSFGLYRSYRLSPSSREWRDLATAVVVASVPLWLSGDFFRFEYATPTFFGMFLAVTLIALGAERRAFRFLARSMRRHGRNLRNAVVVGSGDATLEMASRLARRADLGYRIVEVLDVESKEFGGPNGNGTSPVLVRISELVASQPIDEVFVSLPLDAAQPLIRAIVGLCEDQGITIRMVTSLVELFLARAQIDEIDGHPVVTIFTGPPDSLRLVAKRALDVTVSSLALVLLAPLLAVVALAIKLDSRGPVLFVQERVGLNGRRFRFFKFRTMVDGAERMQAALEPFNEADGPVFKIRNDPRLTRVGGWIRRVSIDELPQFLNVLRGDMSLVGPRPLPIRDVERFDVPRHKRRFSVKPGITCLWQVNGREPRFDDWIKTDMEYIDNWSLSLDVKILLKTIPAVLSGRGAY